MTLYVQADIDQDIGNAVLTGNVGVQAINTAQKSSGLVSAGGVNSPLTAGAEYWDVLPSMNLSVRFDSDFIVRLAASRQIQRPRLDDLRVANSYGVTTSVDGLSPTGLYPYLSGGGGNPRLRPYRANAVDLTFEKYFGGTSGVVAVQLFYKDIVSYIDSAPLPFDYTGYILPAGPTPATLIGLINAPGNTVGATFTA